MGSGGSAGPGTGGGSYAGGEGWGGTMGGGSAYGGDLGGLGTAGTMSGGAGGAGMSGYGGGGQAGMAGSGWGGGGGAAGANPGYGQTGYNRSVSTIGTKSPPAAPPGYHTVTTQTGYVPGEGPRYSTHVVKNAPGYAADPRLVTGPGYPNVGYTDPGMAPRNPQETNIARNLPAPGLIDRSTNPQINRANANLGNPMTGNIGTIGPQGVNSIGGSVGGTGGMGTGGAVGGKNSRQ